MLRTLARLLRVLNSETHPAQIAGAVALAAVMGLTPLWSLHNLLILLLVLILRINLSTFLVSFAVFSGIAYLIDPWFHRLGLALLTSEALQGVWTALYGTVLGRLSGFNNTVLMGSLVASLAAAIVLYPAMMFLVRRYRETVREWVARSRLMVFLKANKFYRIYSELRG